MIGVAKANLILNGSFELGVDSGKAITIFAFKNIFIENWDVYLNIIDYIGIYWLASDGQKSIDVSGEIAGAIQQSFVTTVGYQYKVTFDLAGNPNPDFIDKIKITCCCSRYFPRYYVRCYREIVE